jgi:hypothetical protein
VRVSLPELAERWADMIGVTLASASRPVAVDVATSTLVVEVHSSRWRDVFERRSRDLLHALPRRIDDVLIVALDVRVVHGRAVPC